MNWDLEKAKVATTTPSVYHTISCYYSLEYRISILVFYVHIDVYGTWTQNKSEITFYTGARNDLLDVDIIMSCNIGIAVSCRMLSSFVGKSYCEITFGTNASRYYSYVSDKAGGAGDVIIITIPEIMAPNNTYLFNVSTKGGNTKYKVLGAFKTGMYSHK